MCCSCDCGALLRFSEDAADKSFSLAPSKLFTYLVPVIRMRPVAVRCVIVYCNKRRSGNINPMMLQRHVPASDADGLTAA